MKTCHKFISVVVMKVNCIVSYSSMFFNICLLEGVFMSEHEQVLQSLGCVAGFFLEYPFIEELLGL